MEGDVYETKENNGTWKISDDYRRTEVTFSKKVGKKFG